MTPERWQDIKGQVKDNFSIEEEGGEHLEEEGGMEVEYLVFAGPLGRMRLEFITKPVILDKKTTFSKRIGSETKVDYVYSQTEMSYILQVYKWDAAGESWVEIDAEMFK